MKKSYLAGWLLILAFAAAGTAWVTAGRAFVRRTMFGPVPIPESARTESSFLAVLLPHVAAASGKHALTARELASFLDGLKTAGYFSISLQDVSDFYAKGRLLPPKAVLVAFAEDDLLGVGRADSALKEARWRGALFITGTAAGSSVDLEHQLLTAHAQEQMRLGRAWQFGAISSAEPISAPATGGIRALLDDDGARPAPRRPGLYPVRFKASTLGYNDAQDAPGALHMLALRPDRAPRENVRIVESAWPREAAFTDSFASGFGSDWIPGWGTVSAGNGRLALLPTPRQTGAGVFLRGTERWRDVVLEFDLKKYQKEFWAYARDAEDGSFVRVGARSGYWYVEQKTGANSLPTMLARAPILEGSLPAHVRLVLKGNSAIVHVNGRMQFGRALRVSSAVAQGRILLGVYDARQRSAFAVLTNVSARPADQDWIAAKDNGGRAEFDEERLDVLREQAVYARALSPRWIAIAGDGGVAVSETQGGLIRSLAGFYSCRLVPMAELPPAGAWTTAAGSQRLAAALDAAVGGLGAAGLNLRLSPAALGRPETARLLARLRDDFQIRRRELWITVEGNGRIDPAIDAPVDGVLRPLKTDVGSLELLRAARGRAAASRPQWETASNQ